MKLRLFRDSLRLRLSKDDVAELVSKGCVRCETNLTPTSKFIYQLSASAEAITIRAAMNAGEILVEVPVAMAKQWGGSEEVTLRASQPAGEQRTLSILIEKDFECLAPRGDEPGEALYRNPRMHAASGGGAEPVVDLPESAACPTQENQST